MQELSLNTMPPRELMEKIMDKNGKIYCFLWDKKNQQGKVFVEWQELDNLYHKNSFRTCMRNLLSRGVLKSYRENEKGVKIELSAWSE